MLKERNLSKAQPQVGCCCCFFYSSTISLYYIAVDLNCLPHNVHHGASQSTAKVYSKAVSGNEYAVK